MTHYLSSDTDVGLPGLNCREITAGDNWDECNLYDILTFPKGL